MAASKTVSHTSFGSRLRRARMALGIAPQDAAERCKASRSTYYSWELGTRLPSINRIASIARAMRVSPALLLPTERAA